MIVSYIDRSGSTVLEHILKNAGMNPRFMAKAVHNANIICMRDIRDVIVSHKRIVMSLKDKHKEFIRQKMTKKDIEEYFTSPNNRISGQLKGLDALRERRPEIEIWRYENWYNNYDWIFDKLEQEPWNHPVPSEEREEIKKVFSIKTVRKLIKNDEGLKNFSQWRTKHMFHGDHIWRGQPGSWKILVPKDLHGWFNELCTPILIRWGYEV